MSSTPQIQYWRCSSQQPSIFVTLWGCELYMQRNFAALHTIYIQEKKREEQRTNGMGTLTDVLHGCLNRFFNAPLWTRFSKMFGCFHWAFETKLTLNPFLFLMVNTRLSYGKQVLFLPLQLLFLRTLFFVYKNSTLNFGTALFFLTRV